MTFLKNLVYLKYKGKAWVALITHRKHQCVVQAHGYYVRIEEPITNPLSGAPLNLGTSDIHPTL
jgi:cephalosporin-C deacetylase-like acetyl esterase